MKRFVLILFLLNGLFGSAQEGVELLNKVNQKLKDYTDYQMSMTYSLYKTHFSTEIEEQYNGKFVKLGLNTYSKVKNTEFIRVKNHYLTISNDEKIILLTKNDFDLLNQFNIEKLIANSDSIFVRDSNTEYHLEITPKGLLGNMFALIILRIDKKTYFINGISYFFEKQVDFSTDFRKTDFNRPRLDISFYDFTKKIQLKEGIFEESNYYKSRGAQLYGVGIYASYEFINGLEFNKNENL